MALLATDGANLSPSLSLSSIQGMEFAEEDSNESDDERAVVVGQRDRVGNSAAANGIDRQFLSSCLHKPSFQEGYSIRLLHALL